jgi:serine/threonine protein kinase
VTSSYNFAGMTVCAFCSANVPEQTMTCPDCGASVTGLQLLAGSTLLNKYHIEKVLGQGGFGITYRAKDKNLNRTVAIKELFPNGSTRRGYSVIAAPNLGPQGFENIKERFLLEARTLGRFSHPHIVQVFDIFEANNTAYMVMEALEGESLGSVINRKSQISTPYAIRIAQDIGEALEMVHSADLLHRDIKPDNIFITRQDRAVLIDFGSARGFQIGKAMRHTQLVTPGYAAPEQYASEAKFGTYTDVYGLTATLYHALTGKPPPTATDRLIENDTDLHLPSQIVEPVRTALIRGLTLRVNERPQTIKDFLDLLEPKSNPLLPKPQATHEAPEQILARHNNVLITSRQIEITTVNQRSSETTSYSLKEIAEVNVTNDPSQVPFLVHFGYTPFLVLAGAVILVAASTQSLFFGFIAFVVVALIEAIFFAMFYTSRSMFFLVITKKSTTGYDNLIIPGKKILVLSIENGPDVQAMAQRIRPYLNQA